MSSLDDFAIEREAIFACDPSRIFMILSDLQQWPAEGEPRVLKISDPRLVQLSFADATRVRLEIERSEEAGKSTLFIRHELISNFEQRAHWNEYWDAQLVALRSRVEL